MMLATLHGLTRSRPDLLAESMSTFSTFAAPSRMPKDEIGMPLCSYFEFPNHGNFNANIASLGPISN